MSQHVLCVCVFTSLQFQITEHGFDDFKACVCAFECCMAHSSASTAKFPSFGRRPREPFLGVGAAANAIDSWSFVLP
jgi:hypothetical protein